MKELQQDAEDAAGDAMQQWFRGRSKHRQAATARDSHTGFRSLSLMGACVPDRATVARLAIVSALLVGGCASLTQSVETPQIQLAKVNLADAGLTSQTFVLDFTADNPNPIALPISSISYAVNLAGQSFAEGQSEQSFTLPANGAGEFSVRVRTNLIESARTLSRLVLAGGQRELDYDLSGKLKVNLPFAKALPFHQSGTVSLDR